MKNITEFLINEANIELEGACEELEQELNSNLQNKIITLTAKCDSITVTSNDTDDNIITPEIELEDNKLLGNAIESIVIAYLNKLGNKIKYVNSDSVDYGFADVRIDINGKQFSFEIKASSRDYTNVDGHVKIPKGISCTKDQITQIKTTPFIIIMYSVNNGAKIEKVFVRTPNKVKKGSSSITELLP